MNEEGNDVVATIVEDPSRVAQSPRNEWRYHHAAATVQPRGHVYVSEPISYGGETFNLRAPSAPALFLSAAIKARDTAAPRFADLGATDHSDFFDCLEGLAACVAFSFTALETFANEELPEGLVYIWRRSKKKEKERLVRPQVERLVSLAEKLDAILPGSKGVVSPKGSKLWEDFVWLTEIRNRLIHLKKYRTGHGPRDTNESYVWQDILDPRVRRAPEMAFEMIRHFLPWATAPSWIRECLLNGKKLGTDCP